MNWECKLTVESLKFNITIGSVSPKQTNRIKQTFPNPSSCSITEKIYTADTKPMAIKVNSFNFV